MTKLAMRAANLGLIATTLLLPTEAKTDQQEHIRLRTGIALGYENNEQAVLGGGHVEYDVDHYAFRDPVLQARGGRLHGGVDFNLLKLLGVETEDGKIAVRGGIDVGMHLIGNRGGIIGHIGGTFEGEISGWELTFEMGPDELRTSVGRNILSVYGEKTLNHLLGTREVNFGVTVKVPLPKNIVIEASIGGDSIKKHVGIALGWTYEND